MKLARLPEDVRARWPTVAARLDALEILVDKARFAELLDRLSVPHPLTRPVASVEEMAALDPSRLTGCFLKPTDSQRFFSHFGVKAARAEGAEEAVEWVSRAHDVGVKLVVQEYIPGPGDLHYYVEGYFTGDPETSSWFARRRLRIYPPDFGNSTRMRSVPMDEVQPARDALARLLADLRFRGIFSAEFKRDPRDGEFKLLEVNARPWWYVEFAVRCGVDVVYWGYRDALALPLEAPSDYDVGRTCVYPYYDFHAVRESSGLVSALFNTFDWVGARQPIFRWRDPAPAFHAAADVVLRRLRRSGPPTDGAA
jgi:predicted ATP-grasp superfamily ATP-dependent carboligase